MAKNTNPLTEKVLVSTDTKQALMSIREPGERYGDVIVRVLQDRKRHDFIAHPGMCDQKNSGMSKYLGSRSRITQARPDV
ncbi:MAG: hypothetical protein WCB46_05880 [Methanoregula sp.]